MWSEKSRLTKYNVKGSRTDAAIAAIADDCRQNECGSSAINDGCRHSKCWLIK